MDFISISTEEYVKKLNAELDEEYLDIKLGGIQLGKYLVLAVVGVCLYLYADLYSYVDSPRSIQATAQHEVVVQVHNPIMPLSATEMAMREKADESDTQDKVLQTSLSSPIKEE